MARDIALRVYLTSEEKKEIHNAALRGAGKTVSEWAREVLLAAARGTQVSAPVQSLVAPAPAAHSLENDDGTMDW